MPDTSVKFYVDIDKILERKKITLTQLADKTGISLESLSRIKRTQSVSLKTLEKIASGLNETDLNGLISAEIYSSGEVQIEK